MNAATRARRLAPILVTLLIGAAASLPFVANAQDLDVVIANGRVIDPESGVDAIRNIGIRAGRIESITT